MNLQNWSEETFESEDFPGDITLKFTNGKFLKTFASGLYVTSKHFQNLINIPLQNGQKEIIIYDQTHFEGFAVYVLSLYPWAKINWTLEKVKNFLKVMTTYDIERYLIPTIDKFLQTLPMNSEIFLLTQKYDLPETKIIALNWYCQPSNVVESSNFQYLDRDKLISLLMSVREKACEVHTAKEKLQKIPTLMWKTVSGFNSDHGRHLEQKLKEIFPDIISMDFK